MTVNWSKGTHVRVKPGVMEPEGLTGTVVGRTRTGKYRVVLLGDRYALGLDELEVIP